MKKILSSFLLIAVFASLPVFHGSVYAAWGYDAQQPAVYGGVCVYECERNAALSVGAAALSGLDDFSGNGYVRLAGSGSYFEMKISVLVPGYYRLLFRASGMTEAGAFQTISDKLLIDGAGDYYLHGGEPQPWEALYPESYNSGSGEFVPLPGGPYFYKGEHTIRVFNNGGGSASYDALGLMPVYVQLPRQNGNTLKYECEESFSIAADSVYTHAPSYGSSGAGYQELLNGSFELTVFVPAAGNYFVETASMRTDANSKCDYFKVNNGTNYLISTPDTVPANTWHVSGPGRENWENGYVVPLPPVGGITFLAGRNTVTISANWGYCAYDYILLTPADCLLPESQGDGGLRYSRYDGVNAANAKLLVPAAGTYLASFEDGEQELDYGKNIIPLVMDTNAVTLTLLSKDGAEQAAVDKVVSLINRAVEQNDVFALDAAETAYLTLSAAAQKPLVTNYHQMTALRDALGAAYTVSLPSGACTVESGTTPIGYIQVSEKSLPVGGQLTVTAQGANDWKLTSPSAGAIAYTLHARGDPDKTPFISYVSGKTGEDPALYLAVTLDPSGVANAAGVSYSGNIIFSVAYTRS
ncbi:MAG: hypothetical protein LBL15_03325 [Oscillospiraceae bacterium]|jgi:hypothetical protein|nr:hypothetical protein [Oscillospiraceae bacterium]